MIKSFLILISLFSLLFSSKQIILVVADDFNSSSAQLSMYEGDKVLLKNIPVNIGKKGLGWGIGIQEIPHHPNEPLKYEGDKKAPAGIFKLSKVFGYQDMNLSMPFLKTNKNVICVDDTNSIFYNKILQNPKKNPKSYEVMLREDDLYSLGVIVEHNPKGVKKRGSCIFLHVERKPPTATVGCTSMSKDILKKIVLHLDDAKEPLLIQVPKQYLPEIYKRYPQLQKRKN